MESEIYGGGDLVVTSVMAIIFIPGLNVCRKDENNSIAKFMLKNKFRHVTYEVKWIARLNFQSVE